MSDAEILYAAPSLLAISKRNIIKSRCSLYDQVYNKYCILTDCVAIDSQNLPHHHISITTILHPLQHTKPHNPTIPYLSTYLLTCFPLLLPSQQEEHIKQAKSKKFPYPYPSFPNTGIYIRTPRFGSSIPSDIRII